MSALFEIPRALPARSDLSGAESASADLRRREDDPVLARAGRLVVTLARNDEEIERALTLRWRVFAGEMGAAVGDSDKDLFDPWCRHLIATDQVSGEVIGTYRLLEPAAAGTIGCCYTDGEFWLSRLDPIRPRMVELGRSCVHPDYRSGAAIKLLWAGLGEFLARNDYGYLIGCASVSMADGGAQAAALYRQLATTHLAAEDLRVWPRERLAIERFEAPQTPVVPPPLVKGYLRVGARLLGEPHVDAAFGCADLPMLLALDDAESRYLRRFAPGLDASTAGLGRGVDGAVGTAAARRAQSVAPVFERD